MTPPPKIDRMRKAKPPVDVPGVVTDRTVITHGQISLDQFMRIMQWTDPDNYLLAQRIFRIIFHNKGAKPCMSFEQLVTVLALLSDTGSNAEKIHLSFNVFDTDDNGVLDWRELQLLLRIGMHSNMIFLNATQLDGLARHTMLVR